jgi:hypothetical protein
MLKLFQFNNADWLVVTLSCEPFCCALAEPDTTVMPVGLANRFSFRAAAHSATSKNNLRALKFFQNDCRDFMAFQNW